MTVYNVDNTEWRSGKYKLFLGESPALHDSINRPHQKIFDYYKLQKSIDWSEDEVNLEQSRLDMVNASRNNYDIMLKNLAFQWELDSVASRAIALLFAPFVSNSELWAWYMKCSEMEVTHALTYSEIIRQCLSDPQEAIAEAMLNEEMVKRAVTVIEAFTELETVGAKLTLGLLDKTSLQVRDAVLMGVVALYVLERIEFMSSFAATFAMGEQGIFQGMCKLISKIATDEQCHYSAGEEVLRIMYEEDGWKEDFARNKDKIQKLFYDVVEQELSWNTYLFSEGRNIVGLNKPLLDDWVKWNAQDAASNLFVVDYDWERINESPLPWMDNWLDINRIQVANQEGDTTNYSLNVVVDDIGDDELEF